MEIQILIDSKSWLANTSDLFMIMSKKKSKFPRSSICIVWHASSWFDKKNAEQHLQHRHHQHRSWTMDDGPQFCLLFVYALGNQNDKQKQRMQSAKSLWLKHYRCWTCARFGSRNGKKGTRMVTSKPSGWRKSLQNSLILRWTDWTRYAVDSYIYYVHSNQV